MMELRSDGELFHYGIPGQKWGVRRYQNLDGTRTPEGKARERTSDEPSKKKGGLIKKAIKSKVKEYKTGIKNTRMLTKNPRRMTDDELDKAIARLKKEELYHKSLSSLNEATKSKGRLSIEKSLDIFATESARNISKKLFGEKEKRDDQNKDQSQNKNKDKKKK